MQQLRMDEGRRRRGQRLRRARACRQLAWRGMRAGIDGVVIVTE
jgi:hypothetical protein